ncbi:MAG: transcription termination/antitermination NusG family protein [Planctomycetaceae bacterium]
MPDDATSVDTAGEMQWFVLKVQTNRERSIRESLLKRIKLEGMEEFFGEVRIPTEKVAETKGEASGSGAEAVSGLHDDSDDPHG